MSKLVNTRELDTKLDKLYSQICCVKQELEDCSVVESCLSNKYIGPGQQVLSYDGVGFTFINVVAGTAYPTVNTFADLPLAGTVIPPNNLYLVLTTTGVWFINRKERGIYTSDGVSWTRLGDVQSIFVDDTFQIQDAIDLNKVVKFNVDNLVNPSLKYYQDGTNTIAELKDIPTFVISGNTSGTVSSLSSGTIYLQGGNNITLSQNGNSIAIIGGAGGAGAVTDYISIGESTLFQQTSQMSGYQLTANNSLSLDTSYTSHTHSQYLASSLSTSFININQSTLFQSTGPYLTTQSDQAFSAQGGSTTFQTLDFKNANGFTFSNSGGSIVGSYTNPTDYISTNQSSLFRATSDNSQLQFSSQMSNYQLTSDNSLSLGTGYTTHTHSQYLNTSQSSLFQNTSLMSNYQTTGNYLTTQSNQVVSFTSGSATFESLKFTNSNGFSFNSGTQGIYGSYSVPSDYVSSSQSSLFQLVSNTSNITSNALNTNQSSLFEQSSHTTVFLTTQSGQAYSAANGSNTFQTLSFANSNGISWSTGTQGLFGTVKTDYQTSGNYLTTAMVSDAGSRFVNTSVVLNLTNISATLNSNAISLSVAAPSAANFNVSAGSTSNNLTALTFSNSNGISFGLNGSVITGSVNTNYQSQGAYLTTAALSQDSSKYAGTGVTTGGGTGLSATLNTAGLNFNIPSWITTAMLSNVATISNINISGGSTSSNLSNFKLIDTNGVSWSLDTGSKIYATVKTDYQSSGNYLTTARASNDAIGLNTALTGNGVAWTVNSSGISLNIPAFLTTAALSGDSSKYAGINSAITNGLMTVNTSGISLNLSNLLTTAMLSNASTQFVQANAVFNGTNASGTIASNGISISVAPSVGDGYNILGVNGAATQLSTTLVLSDGNNVSFGLNAGTITASASFNQSIQTQNLVSILGSTGNISFQNSNGITFGGNASTITASHNGLTTARASNDAIGLNTAQTNVTWTVNSSGISLNAGAYFNTSASSNFLLTANSSLLFPVSGTSNFAGTGLSLTNLTGTLNSLGLQLSASPSGSSAYTVILVNSTPYSAVGTLGEYVLLVDATAGNITINLPTAVGNTAKFTIKKIDSSANTVTVDGNSTETIDGDLTKVILFQNTAFSIVSDNANWIRI